MSYYQQAMAGQWQIMQNRVPVERIIDDAKTTPDLRARLQLSQRILAFAQNQLGLDGDGR